MIPYIAYRIIHGIVHVNCMLIRAWFAYRIIHGIIHVECMLFQAWVEYMHLGIAMERDTVP